jgi:3-phosphoshikimate 1-carboxyvinyltransferase
MSLCIIQKPSDSFIRGTIRLNGSKSISNRVLVIDALCGHGIQMENLSNADDTVTMHRLLNSKESVLDAGAGGTTYRFLTAYLATQEGREVILTGSERMQQRPIKILVNALRSLGADIEYENNEHYPPLRIKGKKLKGGKISLPADTSSQYITALLLIAPLLKEGLELELTGTTVSLPYIKMTLRIMEYFGIGTEFLGNTITVKPGEYVPRPFFVEGDWSAASYFYAISILADSAEIELTGLTKQQIQGDSVIAEIASQFGIETTWNKNSILIKKTNQPRIDNFHFDFLECPDLAQTVLALCAASGIELHCNGLQTLRIKETDRISAMDNELQKLNLATLKEESDNLWILKPVESKDEKKITPIDTYEDHRMAMSFAPLSLKINGLKIEDPQVVSKSYPMFWDDLERLGFEIKFQ